MNKKHVWPEGHWNWPIEVNHKHGVRCGEMIWVGGQVDLTPQGEVCNSGDIATQTANVIRNFATVLEALDCDLQDLVQLLCFYVNDGSVDEAEFLALVAAALPEGTVTTVNAVPVPYLAYENMLVEIEGYAMRREDGERTSRTYASNPAASLLKPPFCQALRSGKMIFVSAQYPTDADGVVQHPGDIVAQTNYEMTQIGSLLAEFGAQYDDVVKNNRWYAGSAGVEDFEPAALACAAHFTEPGPAATGIPLPRHAHPDVTIKLSCVAMLAEDGSRLERRHVWPDSLWDWTVHLPYKHGLKCAEMVFLGGQVSLNKKGEAVHPFDLTAQTHQAMTHIGTILNELGVDYDDVCKVTTVYHGDCGAEALHANLPVRSSYFSDPGPATTGVPLPELAYEGMMIEIDVFAMTEPD